MARRKIDRDLIDTDLINKIQHSKIPYNRIERECSIPMNTLKTYVLRGHIPMKHRTNLKKYFKFLREKLG